MLKRLGHAVVVLERNVTPLLHNHGAGIVAGGDLGRFLDQHDDTHTSMGVESRFRQHIDRRSTIVDRARYSQYMTSWDLLYNTLRANFDLNDCSYIPVPRRRSGEGTTEYRYDAKVTEVRDTNDGVEVMYVNHEGQYHKQMADVVIAADGAGSKIREILAPEIVRAYAGYVAFRGTVLESAAPELCQNTFTHSFTFYTTNGMQILT